MELLALRWVRNSSSRSSNNGGGGGGDGGGHGTNSSSTTHCGTSRKLPSPPHPSSQHWHLLLPGGEQEALFARRALHVLQVLAL